MNGQSNRFVVEIQIKMKIKIKTYLGTFARYSTV